VADPSNLPPEVPNASPSALPPEVPPAPSAQPEPPPRKPTSTLLAQPRVLPASAGWDWIVMGWALYRKAPLFWLLLIMLMWLCIAVLGIVPIVGALVAFMLLPGFGAGFAAAGVWLAALNVEEAKKSGFKKGLPGGKPITPAILFEGFKRNGRAQVQLGAMYLAAMVLGMGLSALVDDGAFFRLMLMGKRPPIEVMRSDMFMLAAYVALTAYIPISGAFWFAPALLLFATPEDNMTAGKALFFSFFAFTRNLRAFFIYAAAWGVILMVIGGIVAALASAVSSSPLQLARGMMLPIGLMVMAVVFCTFYASYVTIYAPKAPVPENA
jgi:hypothetical protein